MTLSCPPARQSKSGIRRPARGDFCQSHRRGSAVSGRTVGNCPYGPAPSWERTGEWCLRAWRGFAPSHWDRESTRLNSSHGYISFALLCLKKKEDQLLNVLKATGLSVGV